MRRVGQAAYVVAIVALASGSVWAQGTNYSNVTGAVTNIPDAPISGAPTPAVSSLIIADSYTIGALNSITVRGINHSAVGDLITTLVHVPTGTTVDLFSTVGKTTNGAFDFGDDSNLNGDYVFALAGADFGAAVAAGNSAYNVPFNVTYAASTSAIPGQARTTTVASFNGENVAGEWQLRITDTATGDVGSFLGFVLNVSSVAVPEPGTMALISLGSAAFGFCLRRRKHT